MLKTMLKKSLITQKIRQYTEDGCYNQLIILKRKVSLADVNEKLSVIEASRRSNRQR
jgi:hypothetical protein